MDTQPQYNGRPRQQHLPMMDEMVKISMTIPRRDVQKVQAWMQSDVWQQAQKLRDAEYEQQVESLVHCVRMAQQDHGGARVMAQFLASLYNGNRVRADVSDIGNLDMANFEHLMNVLRLCKETHSEPHEFIVNGGEIFERIIKVWKLEKRTRTRQF
jgi:ABC-type transporter Mla MlaB component